jgi:methylmalonyl-CoA carboxyltransferase small subunit
MKLKVTVDGKTYEVEVEVAPELPPVLPMFLTQSAPATIVAAPPVGGVAGEAVADETKVCRSPVSGIVVKSNVRNGQTIETGDILFVLEAMKMETEITAPIAGKVKAIHVNAGNSVKSGQVVLEWE